MLRDIEERLYEHCYKRKELIDYSRTQESLTVSTPRHKLVIVMCKKFSKI